MGVYVPGIVLPDTCLECVFLSKPEEIGYIGEDGEHYYKKIYKCMLADPDIEDPWRTTHWVMYNKEEWCPLKEIEFGIDLGKEEE